MKVNDSDISAIILAGIPPLFGAAQNGDAHGAMVAMRRLLVGLRTVNADLAQQLKAQLPGSQPAASVRRLEVTTPAPQPRAPQPRDADTRADLLKTVNTELALKPVMEASDAAILDRLLVEHQNSEALSDAGVAARNTLFLVGPPGVGKTMTASWLAQQLAVPLYEIDIPSLISSYLGRTGQNLREVFDFARSEDCVILLDEFDAIAKRRDDQGDLGEMRRIVSVLLKEIEEWPGPSVLVAATNHAELIDPAVFRRFQIVLRIKPPGKSESAEILRLHLGSLEPSEAVLDLASNVLAGVSGSDIRSVAHETRRAVVLDSRLGASEALLIQLGHRVNTIADRRLFARTARAIVKQSSFADIARWLGVSKASIHNYLKDE